MLELALKSATTPSVLALTRQNLPQIRSGKEPGNLSALGAYELVPAEGTARVSLFASGSEIEIAVAARTLLAARGIDVRIVSVPCFEMFEKQDEAYRARVIGTASVKIGIEAAVRMGWDRLIGSDGIFIGMTGFGASAPYKELYAQIGRAHV